MRPERLVAHACPAPLPEMDGGKQVLINHVHRRILDLEAIARLERSGAGS